MKRMRSCINVAASRESAAKGSLRISAALSRDAATGFTLIELLVVIAIIALLSGLIVNLLPKASDAKVRSRVRAELSQLELTIDYYKDKRGYYPPDNPANPGTNSLYYE